MLLNSLTHAAIAWFVVYCLSMPLRILFSIFEGVVMLPHTAIKFIHALLMCETHVECNSYTRGETLTFDTRKDAEFAHKQGLTLLRSCKELYSGGVLYRMWCGVSGTVLSFLSACVLCICFVFFVGLLSAAMGVLCYRLNEMVCTLWFLDENDGVKRSAMWKKMKSQWNDRCRE